LLDPGLLFILIDLDWFIDFEERDQRRRADLMEKMQSPSAAREPPAPEVYRAYEIQQGVLGEEEIIGLYSTTAIF
jgi:hypothetical protein